MKQCRLAIFAVAVFALWPWSAAAQTAVSTYTAGPTVTVTTGAAHGLAVNQGACLSNLTTCGVVSTVPTSTSFTFAQTGVVACASTCGTVTAAPQVIVLSTSAPDQTHVQINWVCWLTTQSPIPATGTASGWKSVTGISVGASASQTNALGAGSFIEQARSQTFATTLSGAQLEQIVQADCAGLQASLAANIQPSTYYGFVWNGTAWVRQ